MDARAIADADPLRVVLLHPRPRPCRWTGELRVALERNPEVKVTAEAWLDCARASRRQPALFHLFERMDRSRQQQREDALAPATGSEAPLEPLRLEGEGEASDRHTLERPPPLDVDLFLWLGEPGDLKGVADRFAGLAPLGIWALQHGDCESIAAWNEFRRGEPIVSSNLLVYAQGAGRASPPKCFHMGVTRLDRSSLHRSRSLLAWSSLTWLERAVGRAARGGIEALEPASPLEDAAARAEPRPGNLSVLSLAAKSVAGAVRRRFDSQRFAEEWIIAIRPVVGQRRAWQDAGDFRTIPPRAGRSYCDPFLLRHEGRSHLFFEDLPSAGGNAHIAWLPLEEPEAHPRAVLERHYHLSYPNVFARAGAVWMVPESYQNRRIELYRADPFPEHWTLHSVILDDIAAIDPTLLFQDDGVWLFFTRLNRGTGHDGELFLYHARDLDGPWEPHPKNPIVTDIRCARPAGRIFQHEGAIIRPAQDCSYSYGYATVFNQIDCLTTDDYAEHTIGRLEPTWRSDLVATHAYDFDGQFEVIDGRRRVRR